MAEKEIHHVRLHYGSPGEYVALLVGVAVLIAGMLIWVSRRESQRADMPPFVLDLRNEGVPLSIDIKDNGRPIVKLERADAIETRIYGATSGKLIGTVWTSKPAANGVEPE